MPFRTAGVPPALFTQKPITHSHTKQRVANPLRPHHLPTSPRLRHHRIARIRRTLLPRRRHRQTKMLPRIIINPPRRPQSRIFHMQLLIQLERLRPRRLQLFQLIVNLNALKMLPGVAQQTSRHRRANRHRSPAIIQPRLGRRPRQSRIINALHCVILRRMRMRHDPLPAVRISAGDNFSATRIFALRARGFVRISSSPG